MTNETLSTLKHQFLTNMSIWKRLLEPYQTNNHTIQDEITGEQISVMDILAELNSKIQKLEQDILFLKEENIENSNLIYELMHSLDALDARIDIVTAEEFLREKDV